ncbi:MAG: hypothetical protein ACYS5V_13050, partial [Planctomycetota bacterium]
DLFDAGDLESLFWCVPGPTGKRCPILLVHPDNVTIKSTIDDVRPISISTPLTKICEIAHDEMRIVTIATAFFDPSDVMGVIARWAKEIMHISFNHFRLDVPICVMLREAANVVFSRMKGVPGDNSTEAKRSLVDLMRRARHFEISLAMDAQRFKDLYSTVRDNMDRIWMKKHAFYAIPQGLKWVNDTIQMNIDKWYPYYPQIIERYPPITQLRPDESWLILPDDGEFHPLKNTMPPFRHKSQGDMFFDLMPAVTYSFNATEKVGGVEGREIASVVTLNRDTALKMGELIKFMRKNVSPTHRPHIAELEAEIVYGLRVLDPEINNNKIISKVVGRSDATVKKKYMEHLGKVNSAMGRPRDFDPIEYGKDELIAQKEMPDD